MPPSRRTPGSRRPRVAGLRRPGQPGTDQRPDGTADVGAERADTADTVIAAPPVEPGVVEPDATEPDSAEPEPRAQVEQESTEATTSETVAGDEVAVPDEAIADSDPVVGTATRPVSKPKARRLKPRPQPVSGDPETTAASAGADRVTAGAGVQHAGSVSRSSRVAVLVALALLAVGAVVAAGIFRQQGLEARDQARGNGALVDVATTGQVNGQISDALQVLFSYDYARLDDNEQAARGVVTDDFAPDLTEQYADIRELAPQLQAVVVATVDEIAVSEIDGDRAVLLVYLTQQATRGQAPQNVAQTRLTVTAERVDDRWRIDDVDSL